MKKLLNSCGAVLLILLVIAVLPLTLPKLLGYTPYNILTGSMEPVIPTHSVVYVKRCEPSQLQVGDVITYRLGTGTELVQTHRIEAIDENHALFTTKGDANMSVDQTRVKAENIVGRVVFHIPQYGKLAEYIRTSEGIAACIAAFAAVLILWISADRIKPKERTP